MQSLKYIHYFLVGKFCTMRLAIYNFQLFSNLWISILVTQNHLVSHYNDVTMGAIASQITSRTIVFSTVYLDTAQRKHQSSASLAFVRGIHRRPVNSPHKWPVTRKMFPFDDVIMRERNSNAKETRPIVLWKMCCDCGFQHYCDVTMGSIASLITSLTSVYSTVHSGADQRKHQSSASLAFVWGIHRRPMNSPHKWPVTRKIFSFDDVIIMYEFHAKWVFKKTFYRNECQRISLMSSQHWFR